MSAPRAVGVRMPYAAVPDHVRAWVERTVGSPVVQAHDQTGGMSPGCATRLRFADGTRLFVKAVGSELNPDTPTMFRREELALRLVGRHPSWAGLEASYDAAGWVALLLEDVEGRFPDLDDDREMAHLLAATDELTDVLAERVPTPPRPDPEHGGLSDLAGVLERWAGALDVAATIPEALLPRWVPGRSVELAAAVRDLAADRMDRLVHWDIRNDNLLVRPDGGLVFLDWGAAAVGPAWADPLLARLERVHLPWFDASLASSSALVAAGDDAVTAWLAGLGTFLAWRAHTAVDVNLPTLREFRLTESARFLAAAARRLGEEPTGDLGGRAGRC